MRLFATVIALLSILLAACDGSSPATSPTATPFGNPPSPLVAQSTTPRPVPTYSPSPIPTIISIEELEPAAPRPPGAPPTLYPTGPCVPQFDQPLPAEVEVGTTTILTGGCLDGGAINRSGQAAYLSDGGPLEVVTWTSGRIELRMPITTPPDARGGGSVDETGPNILRLCVSFRLCYETPVLVPNYMTGGEWTYTPGIIDFRVQPGADAREIAARRPITDLRQMFPGTTSEVLGRWWQATVPEGEEAATVRELAADPDVNWAQVHIPFTSVLH